MWRNMICDVCGPNMICDVRGSGSWQGTAFVRVIRRRPWQPCSLATGGDSRALAQPLPANDTANHVFPTRPN